MKTKYDKRPAIRVAVLEDDPLRFIGLRTLLEHEQDFELSSLGLDDLSVLGDKDIVLLAQQGKRDLASVIDNLRAMKAEIRVVVTGPDSGDEASVRAIAAGAKGYVEQSAPAAEFAQAIRIVNQGLIWAPRRVFSMLIDRSTVSPQGRFVRDRLTSREKEVLQMLVAGRSNKEIASPLGIEERTVKAHVGKLMRKLGAKNRINLSVHAITHSLVTAG
jgi:DNA-binding NarL/FixJ family response regulator